MAQVLERDERWQFLLNDPPDQLLEEEIAGRTKDRSGIIKGTSFIMQPERQLVKGQEMQVEQREPALHGQQPADALAQDCGGNEHREGTEWFAGSGLLDTINESGLEVRMEATGNDLQHLTRVS
jgi:hypothetical protein